MYTKEQVTPKKYPENLPDADGLYWTIGTNSAGEERVLNFIWNNYNREQRMSSWDVSVKWFIDIPDAPDECKPLAYPANKPSEDGIYLTHSKNFDEWKKAGWWGVMV